MPPPHAHSAQVLAIRPGALGDTLLALPALRAVRASFPNAGVHLVGHPGAGEVLLAAGEIDRLTDFDAPQVAGLFSPDASLSAGLVGSADLEAAVAWLSDPDGVVVLALRRLGPRRVLVAPSRPSQPGCHVADHLVRTLSPWRLSLGASRPLVLSGTAAQASPPARVLVHPGSGSPAKNWPPERFAEVIETLGARGHEVGLINGPADARACSELLAHLNAALPVWEPGTALDLAGLLRGAGAYLGNDSGVTHLAAALGVPTVAMFGPTDPCVWAPRGRWVRVVPFETSPLEVAALLERAVAAEPRAC